MKTKLKPVRPILSKELNKYIQDSYYSKPSGELVRPVISYEKRKSITESKYKRELVRLGTEVVEIKEKEFKVEGARFEPIDDRDIKTLPSAREHFIDITYPLRCIIPEPMVKKMGVREMIFKTHKGQPNCIRYYVALMQRKLTEKQCAVLFLDEDIRSTYGYLINNKPMTNDFLISYITYVDTLGKIAEKKSQLIRMNQEIGRQERTLNTMFSMLSSKVKPNADGSRKPMVIQLGVNSYMSRNKLTNPVEIIDVHAKGVEKIKVYDFKNLSSLLQEINVNPQEAFDYVTKYLNKNVDIKRIHTQDREEERGGTALRNLVEFYYAELERTTKLKKTVRTTKLFTYQLLMASDEWKDYCKASKQPAIWSYDKFKKWFAKKLEVYAKLKNLK